MDIEGPQDCDLLIIGASLTGAAIARDASGRGLDVCLAERGDLAVTAAPAMLCNGDARCESGRSGALRAAQAERTRLLSLAPHAVRPIRVIMPEARRSWRAPTLFGPSPSTDLTRTPHAELLNAGTGKARGEPDCVIDEARLVVLNCLDAAERGARIRLRSTVTALKRRGDHWDARLSTSSGEHIIHARAVINAAGPSADAVLAMAFPGRAPRKSRVLRESHAILPRLYNGRHGYAFAADDGARISLLPFGDNFTLLGWTGTPASERAQTPDAAALCMAVSAFLRAPLAPQSVLAGFARLRVGDDACVQAATDGAAPRFMTVSSGRLVTHRLRAERALDQLGVPGKHWTASAPLPGGNVDWLRYPAFIAAQQRRWPWLDPRTTQRLARTYGARMGHILGDAGSLNDLGTQLGAGVSSAELAYLVTHEFVRSARDVLWRRSMLGLTLSAQEQAQVAEWFARAALVD